MFIATIPKFLSAGFVVSICWLFFNDLMEALAFFVRFGSVLARSLGSLLFKLFLVSSM